MTDRRRVYYYFVIGAIGGLTGWLAGTLSVRVLGIPRQSPWSLALYGAILGIAIGLAVTAYDGIMNRSVRRFIKFGLIGMGLGAIAGALALPLGDRLWLYISHQVAGSQTPRGLSWQGLLIGTLCWVIIGGLIGLGEGSSKGTQSWKGLLGGVIGGLSGGMFHELTAGRSDGEGFGNQLFLALSFLILGGAIGAAIAYVTEVLKMAWLEIRNGKFAGRTYDVTKYVDRVWGQRRAAIIGSDQWRAHIYLPSDTEIRPRHATINFANGAPTLTVTPEASNSGTTLINGRRLMTSSPLSDGDRLQFGSTEVIYRHKRRRRNVS